MIWSREMDPFTECKTIPSSYTTGVNALKQLSKQKPRVRERSFFLPFLLMTRSKWGSLLFTSAIFVFLIHLMNYKKDHLNL